METVSEDLQKYSKLFFESCVKFRFLLENGPAKDDNSCVASASRRSICHAYDDVQYYFDLVSIHSETVHEAIQHSYDNATELLAQLTPDTYEKPRFELKAKEKLSPFDVLILLVSVLILAAGIVFSVSSMVLSVENPFPILAVIQFCLSLAVFISFSIILFGMVKGWIVEGLSHAY